MSTASPDRRYRKTCTFRPAAVRPRPRGLHASGQTYLYWLGGRRLTVAYYRPRAVLLLLEQAHVRCQL